MNLGHDIRKAVKLVEDGEGDYINLYCNPFEFIVPRYEDRVRGEQVRRDTLDFYQNCYKYKYAVGYREKNNSKAPTYYIGSDRRATTRWFEAKFYPHKAVAERNEYKAVSVGMQRNELDERKFKRDFEPVILEMPDDGKESMDVNQAYRVVDKKFRETGCIETSLNHLLSKLIAKYPNAPEIVVSNGKLCTRGGELLNNDTLKHYYTRN